MADTELDFWSLPCQSARLIGHLLRSIVKVFNYFNLSWPPLHGAGDTSTTHPDFPDFVFLVLPPQSLYKPVQRLLCMCNVLMLLFLPTLIAHWPPTGKNFCLQGFHHLLSGPTCTCHLCLNVLETYSGGSHTTPYLQTCFLKDWTWRYLMNVLFADTPRTFSMLMFDAKGWFRFFNSWIFFSRDLVCAFLSIILCTVCLNLAKMSDLKLQISCSLKQNSRYTLLAREWFWVLI